MKATRLSGAVMAAVFICFAFCGCTSSALSSLPALPKASTKPEYSEAVSTVSDTESEESASEKSFTFAVVDADGNEREYSLTGSAATVGDALIENGLISGQSSASGFLVTEVCGISADYSIDGTLWAFYINGKPADTAVDSTPIEEGFVYSYIVE